MLIPLISKKDKQVIVTDTGARVVTADALDADWSVFAADNTSTPLTEILQKQQLMQLIPTLAQLGVQGVAIKEELVRLFDLPVTFLEVAPPPPTPVAPAGPPALAAPLPGV